MRKSLSIILASVALLGWSGLAFAQANYEGSPAASTTLSAAITSTSQTSIVLKSCSLTAGAYSNIASSNPQWGLKVDDEMMRVTSVVDATTCLLKVMRGQMGTRAALHGSGQTVWAAPLQYLPSTGPLMSNGSAGKLAYSTVPVGSVAYASFGTDTTTVQYTLYAASVDVPKGFFATGIAKLNGATVATDKHQVFLLDAAGNLVAQSAAGGATTAGANAFQKEAFSPGPVYVPPGQYFLAVQSNGATDGIRTVAASTFIDVVTTAITGTALGTLPAWATPTTFTADKGPIAYLY